MTCTRSCSPMPCSGCGRRSRRRTARAPSWRTCTCWTTATWAVLGRVVRASLVVGALLVLTQLVRRRRARARRAGSSTRGTSGDWRWSGRPRRGHRAGQHRAGLRDVPDGCCVPSPPRAGGRCTSSTCWTPPRPGGTWAATRPHRSPRLPPRGLVRACLDRIGDNVVGQRRPRYSGRGRHQPPALIVREDVTRVADAMRAGTAVGLLAIDPRGGVCFVHDVIRPAGPVRPGGRRAPGARTRPRHRDGRRAARRRGGPATRTTGCRTRGWRARTPGGTGRAGPDCGPAARSPCLTACSRRGLPTAAAEAAARARRYPAVRVAALVTETKARALAGEVEQAIDVAADIAGRLSRIRQRRQARDRRWPHGAVLGQLGGRRDPPGRPGGRCTEAFDVPGTAALHALVALELGDLARAATAARAGAGIAGRGGRGALRGHGGAGRLERVGDLDTASGLVRVCGHRGRGARLALWRARALDELGHHRPAPSSRAGPVEGPPARPPSRQVLRVGVVGPLTTSPPRRASASSPRGARRRAWGARRRTPPGRDRDAGLGRALIGRRTRSPAAAPGGRRSPAEAVSRAPAPTWRSRVPRRAHAGSGGLPRRRPHGSCRAPPGRCRRVTPLRVAQPAPHLAPVATGGDDSRPRGTRGHQARTEVTDLGVWQNIVQDMLWHLAEAVAAGRAGDRDRAASADEAERGGGCARARRTASTSGCGSPPPRHCATDGLVRVVGGRCRQWVRDAYWTPSPPPAVAWQAEPGHTPGAGRGAASVPEQLHRLGVTSREMDVAAAGRRGPDQRRDRRAPRPVAAHGEVVRREPARQDRCGQPHPARRRPGAPGPTTSR